MPRELPEELAALPGVVEVVTDKRELPDLLSRLGVVEIPDGISRFGDRHRAYVKVQDGCLLRCSYCIIPLVRPQMSSRPLDEILDETRRLVRQRLSRDRADRDPPGTLRRGRKLAETEAAMDSTLDAAAPTRATAR